MARAEYVGRTRFGFKGSESLISSTRKVEAMSLDNHVAHQDAECQDNIPPVQQ